MVYESDFYTTRRPYSYRPNVSSYSVTSRIVNVPSIRRVHTYTVPIYSSYPIVRHRSIPYVAHKRLVTGTRMSVTPSRTITRIVSLPSIRASTPIRYLSPMRYSTPIRYPITPISILSSPSRHVHSYTTRISTSPTRTTFSIRTRPSIMYREYKRIENMPRSSPTLSYTNSYLNSEEVRAFDDATKQIRNDTNKLLRKIHTRVERAQSCLPLTSYEAKYEKRYGPDSFVAHLSPLKSTTYNGIESYNPNKYMGKSHLASVRIVGNKCYNTRRATSVYDDDKVRNDVNLLSYYLKNRMAAAENKEPAVVLESSKLDPNRPSRKFSQPKSGDDDGYDEMKEKQALRAKRLAALAEEMPEIDDIALEKKKRQQEEQNRLESEAREDAQKAEELKKQQEQERLAAEQLEQEQLAAEKLEQERLAAEQLEQERLAAEQMEQERLAAKKSEQKRLAAEKREQEKLEAERLQQERLEAEKLEQERLAAEQLEQERLAAEQLEKEKLEAEKLEKEKLEAEKLELERLEAELLEQERLDAEKLEQEILEYEKLQKQIETEQDDEVSAVDDHTLEAPEEPEEQDASVAELTDDESAANRSQEKAIEEERRIQEQKQREIEMARLAELQEIAEEEREAELARQAAELTDLARQQEEEARKQQTEDEEQLTSVASELENSVVEEPSVGKQDIEDEYNDNDNDNEDIVINYDNNDAATDDAHSIVSVEESSKYESEEETE